MRTLIDINDELMNDLLKAANTATKKDAIVLAIKTYLDLKRREKLAALIGRYEFGSSASDLEAMRNDE